MDSYMGLGLIVIVILLGLGAGLIIVARRQMRRGEATTPRKLPGSRALSAGAALKAHPISLKYWRWMDEYKAFGWNLAWAQAHCSLRRAWVFFWRLVVVPAQGPRHFWRY